MAVKIWYGREQTHVARSCVIRWHPNRFHFTTLENRAILKNDQNFPQNHHKFFTVLLMSCWVPPTLKSKYINDVSVIEWHSNLNNSHDDFSEKSQTSKRPFCFDNPLDYKQQRPFQHRLRRVAIWSSCPRKLWLLTYIHETCTADGATYVDHHHNQLTTGHILAVQILQESASM